MQLPTRRRGIPASRSRSSPRTSAASALKPVPRRVWAPVGERPIAHGRHRFDWLYVTVFASQATGENFWYLSNGISKPLFEALLETFAREAEAGLGRIILLVLDDSGWHSAAGLKTLDGIRLVHLPPYSPKLQPAETLWALVDEPIVNNRDYRRSRRENHQPMYHSRRTTRTNPNDNFHWWSRPIAPN
jgi:transposase